MKRYSMIISGRVQGVYYRAFSKREAESLGLKGYVKNLGDGRVELVAEGHEENLSEYVETCRKGPAMARVKNVEIKKSEATDNFEGFEIREG